MAQLGARLDGIEEAVGSNPIGSTNSNLNIPDAYSFHFATPWAVLPVLLRKDQLGAKIGWEPSPSGRCPRK